MNTSRPIVLFILLAAYLCSPLESAQIDILSNFPLHQFSSNENISDKTQLVTRTIYSDFNTYLRTSYTPYISTIIVMNPYLDPADISKLPKRKLSLFLWEPGGAPESYCNLFSRIYTFNDNLVDGITYFKLFYPVLNPMCDNIPPFEQKKFAVMVTHTPTEERIKMVRFFESLPSGELELYGFHPVCKSKIYQGSIPGHPTSDEKIELLKKYRFCICFENSEIPGYITEKIFACFTAGCIPVYWGAPNVERYIPKNCFIDYRKFARKKDLYIYLKNMSKETYNEYINNIRTYLNSEQAHFFSSDYFCETIKSAVQH